MDSYEATFDDMQPEKAIATRKYRRSQSYKSVLTACVALVPLCFALSRSSSFLPAAKLSGDVSRELQAVFDNRFYVFSLVMALLVAVSAFSRQKDDNCTGVTPSPDVYEEHFTVVDGGVYPETKTTQYCRSIFDEEVEYPEKETMAKEEESSFEEGDEYPQTETDGEEEDEEEEHEGEEEEHEEEEEEETLENEMQMACSESENEAFAVLPSEVDNDETVATDDECWVPLPPPSPSIIETEAKRALFLQQLQSSPSNIEKEKVLISDDKKFERFIAMKSPFLIKV